jgi:serine/threonine protein kinase/Tol biopolymer transport system component
MRWDQIEKLFHQAREYADSDRAAFLEKACAGDVELRQEVESLLANDRASSVVGFMGGLASVEARSNVNLSEGQQLGAYTILSVLGKGGMGEVYRARDLKLGRDVAIKVLWPSFAADSDRLARFKREARLLAALNHPNIATIHSIEEIGGRTFLVLELIDGVTLADRLRGGRLSVDESLRIASQIGEALEAAHEKGVIHRDLKPSNIQITADARVKVLDFGLAKIVDDNVDDARTQLTSMAGETKQGVVMGTPAYMSPEQTRGQPVDRRTDVWAFGCVLYEMLVGKVLFQEQTVAGTLAKVLESQVSFDAVPAQTPPAVLRVIKRCLQRDSRQRLQHIGDARLEIQEVLAGISDTTESIAVVKAWPRMIWIVAALAIVAVTAMWFATRRNTPEAVAATTRSFIGPIEAPHLEPFGTRHVAISSDGTQLAYISGTQVFLRPMNRVQAVAVDQSSLATVNPFFSPDGKWLAFAQFYDLKKVPVTGGGVASITTFKGRNLGGTWGTDGTIVFATEAGLFSVSDQGGEPNLLMAPEREGVLLVWPEFLPGGRSLLFTRLPAGSFEAAEIVLLDLKTLKSTVVVRGGTGARYLPDGYLVYATRRGLEAVAFNPETGSTSTDAVLINDVDIKVAADNGAADLAVSGNGTLVHMPPVTDVLSQFVWVDTQGREEVIKTIPPDVYGYPRLSPDRRHIAFDVMGPNRDIYVADLERGTRVRLSEGPNEDLFAMWSGDGRRVYYGSNRGGFHIYSRAADGTGSEELLVDNPDAQMPFWLAPENRMLFFKGPYQAADIGSLNLNNPTDVQWLLHSKYTERNPAVSPNGKWIAYESNESGQNEIWVRPYPDVDRARISIGPGLHARWAPGGNELYYRNADWGMMAVPLRFSPEFQAGVPRQLFPNNRYYRETIAGGVAYDVAPDGRFLMTQAIAETSNSKMMISVVTNWVEELKTLVRHQ